ncbi:MAG: LytTR family DNA-binding domain-containing protein [Crocinitomicaceae bacterium]|nr:LytTR family DNA-binding domain-containing protein [Crocinitomicaceae bacterium]
MRVLIAEDDVFTGENLAMIVSSQGYIVVDVVEGMQEFNKQLDKRSFDAALLDVRMNGDDLGIKMASRLNEIGIPFIFITSFSDKNTLQNTIKFRPHGFVLKPFSKIEIIKVLNKLGNSLVRDSFWVKSAGGMVQVRYADIQYVQSENVYITIYTEKDRVVTRAKLADLIERLPKESFVRTHQSYIVNSKMITNLVDNNLFLPLGVKVPVSRKHQKQVKEIMLRNK